MNESNATEQTTNGIACLVGEKITEFRSHQEWVNKGNPRLAGYRASEIVLFDSRGRVCKLGSHFQRAEKQGTYPITAYEVL